MHSAHLNQQLASLSKHKQDHNEADLFQAEHGMSGCNSFPLCIRERVEHTVVRVDRGKSVLSQLIIHQLNYLCHPRLVVGPVTYDLPRE